MTHYYTNNNDLESKRRVIETVVAGERFSFISDIGVFSKDKVDFGTSLLLEHFEPYKAAASGVDVGCGYGIVGIVLSKIHHMRMTLVDVNDRALLLAEENAERNQVSVQVLRSDALAELIDTKTDVVITNPPIRAGKDVVFRIYEQAAAILVEDGELWIVIQKKQGAASSEKKLTELFNDVEIVAKKKGYQIIKAKSPRIKTR